MARAAREFRVCWGRHLLPALSDFGPERPSSRLDDTWCPPIITEHFATIGSGSGALVPTLPLPVPARWLDSHLEHSQRHLEPARALEDVPKTLRGSGTNSCEGGHEGVRVWGARGGPEAVERSGAAWGSRGQFHRPRRRQPAQRGQLAGDLKSPCPGGLIQAISGHSEPAQHPTTAPAAQHDQLRARFGLPG